MKEIKTIIHLEKVTVYGYIHNGGDGSSSVGWYMKPENIEKMMEDDDTYVYEEVNQFSIETFVGSGVHKDAINSELEYN